MLPQARFGRPARHNRRDTVEPASRPPADDRDDPVPIFGSWPRMYGAVIATAVLWIALSWAFSRWPF